MYLKGIVLYVKTYVRNNIEELADIFEVILALTLELGLIPTELEMVRKNKYDERGGFAEHICLLSVEES